MSATEALLILFVTWAVIGVVTAIVMGRRGHRTFSWALVGTVLGPLVAPLMVSAIRREEPRSAYRSPRSAPSSNALDVLVGVDGSDDARGALETAIALFGRCTDRLTVATVVDYDAGSGNVPPAERNRAAAILEPDARLAETLLERTPDTAILVGRPADTLVRHARDGNYDLIVIAPRGKGASRMLIGSVASQLARGVGIAVAILPPAAQTSE